MSNPSSILPPAVIPTLTAGQKFAGCYVLTQQLGEEKGMQMWIAEDEVMGEASALHFIPGALISDASALSEFREEAKRNRQLIHPHILRVRDVVDDAGRVALVTTVPVGKTLAVLLREKGRFTLDEVRPWIAQLARTLDEAHRIHFVNGGLAPENVFVDESGKLVIAHFGLGRIINKALLRADAAGANSVAASVSPQLLGEQPPSRSDDVYGLAALSYWLVTGAPVFVGEDIPKQVREDRPKNLRDALQGIVAVPPAWDAAFAEALGKTPETRPQSPLQFIAQLESAAPASPTPEAVQDAASATAAGVSESTKVAAAEPQPKKAIEVLREKAALAKQGLANKEIAAKATAAVAGDASAPSDAPPKKAAEMLLERAALAKKMATADAIKAPPSSNTQPTKPDRVESRSPLRGAASGYSATSGHRRFSAAAAVAAAVLLALCLAGYLAIVSTRKSQLSTEISTHDPLEGAELTSVNNADPSPVVEAPTARDITPAAEAGTQSLPAPAVMLAVAGNAPRENAEGTAPSTPDVEGGNKAAALEKLKQSAAAAEKAHQELAAQQKAAEAAATEAQKALEARTKAVAPAAKATEELMALRARKEEEHKVADAAAQQAQQVAAEKAKAAEGAKKALADLDAQNKEKLENQQKAQAELETLQRSLAERQRAAADVAKAVAEADAARKEYAASVKQTEQEVAMAKTAAEAAAAETERKRRAIDTERRKLDDELMAMRTMFEQKMKEIEDRRKQIESGVPTAQVTTTSPIVAASAVPVPPPPRATPAPPEVAPLAMKIDPVKAPAVPPDTGKVATPSQGDAAENSLGMRFVPIGPVQFCIWQTRVKDFDVFARAVNLKSTAWKAPGFKQAPEHPVVNVSWNEAIAFCKWLTDKERKDGMLPANQFYRLPYDLEWSQAVGLSDESGKTPEARDMGVPDIYPWGSAWPPPAGAGNYTGEETNSDVAIKGYDDGFAWTAPVGSFPPNKFGIHDMGGNVWQWCMDSWNGESKAKVLRGASWYNGALKLSLLSSCRVHAAPDSSTDNYGFRIVRVVDAAKAARK